MIPWKKAFGSVFERCCRWRIFWPPGLLLSKGAAMIAPRLPAPKEQNPARQISTSASKAPPRPWIGLSETARRQVAAIVADMVKRMAMGAPREQSDADDHERS
jgi:hypothetical protein